MVQERHGAVVGEHSTRTQAPGGRFRTKSGLPGRFDLGPLRAADCGSADRTHARGASQRAIIEVALVIDRI
jgi:hypothetical protein